MAVVIPVVGRGRVPAVRDLVLLLVVGFLVVQQSLPRMGVLAQDAPAPEANAVLASAFTHQGRITINGVPANGPFDMQVALFDSASGGTVIEVLPLLNGVNVVNGLYTVQLTFAESAFRGQERWLEVSARPSGPGSFTLLGRQQLTATPYALYAKAADWNGLTNVPQALSIGTANCTNGQIWKQTGGTWQCAADETGGGGGNHLGEAWSGSVPTGLSITSLTGKGFFAAGPTGGVEGTTATDGSAGVTGTNTSNCIGFATCYGVRGTAPNALLGVGVRGEGFSAGVSGESFNIGVFGKSALNTGVQGESNSGLGVWGKSSTGSGVYGTTASSSQSVAGVQGFSSANGVGVLGTVAGTSGVGVLGKSPGPGGVGVRAEGGIVAVLAIGQGDGVVAESQSASLGNGVDAKGVGPGVSGAGVYGSNTSNVNCQALGAASSHTYCFGVYGVGGGAAGVGVYGRGINTGVWASGDNVAIYGQSANFAGYFEGTTKVTEAFYAKHVLPLDATAANTNNYIGDTISRWTEIFSINQLNVSSDARMKTNIHDVTYGLDEVLAMRPVSFTWKEKYDDRVHIGLLA